MLITKKSTRIFAYATLMLLLCAPLLSMAYAQDSTREPEQEVTSINEDEPVLIATQGQEEQLIAPLEDEPVLIQERDSNDTIEDDVATFDDQSAQDGEMLISTQTAADYTAPILASVAAVVAAILAIAIILTKRTKKTA